MKTAIIGIGNIGAAVARNLTSGGEHVIVAGRTLEKTKAFAADLGPNATAMSIPEAIDEADVIILSIYLDPMKDLIGQYRGKLSGKIVVDPSNPVGPDGKGGMKKIIPEEQSSGQIIAAMMPEGAEFVKAFGTLAAASLVSGSNRKPDLATLFYATDYPEAGRAIAKLITASGFAPVSVGKADQSIRIEVGGDLHEIGKIGKLVSPEEARAAI
ncbi:MAG: NADPH-dependent F420 reductase [Pseudomonas sp.]